MELLLGTVTGIVFGFFLQKSEVLRFEKQVGFLRLKDMTIIKFMLSAIAVGMVGIYLLSDLGVIELKIKSTEAAAQMIGGILFGVGWAVLGFCPGTAVGALGEGRLHALWGILGMLAGGMVYAHLYPFIEDSVLVWGSFGKATIQGVIGVNHWLVILIFAMAYLLLFKFFGKKGL